jgi:RES domain
MANTGPPDKWNPELGAPPADLDRGSITTIGFDESLFRTHSLQRSPIFYGKTRVHRFDAPDGSYGVLYAGRDLYCAFIETFAKAAGTCIVTTTALREKSLSELRARRALQLIDLTQSGTLVRIGADARLFSGSHDDAQFWSKALHSHPCNAKQME